MKATTIILALFLSATISFAQDAGQNDAGVQQPNQVNIQEQPVPNVGTMKEENIQQNDQQENVNPRYQQHMEYIRNRNMLHKVYFNNTNSNTKDTTEQIQNQRRRNIQPIKLEQSEPIKQGQSGGTQ